MCYYVDDMDECQEDDKQDNIKSNIIRLTLTLQWGREVQYCYKWDDGICLVARRIRLKKNENSLNKAVLYYLLHNDMPCSCPPLVQHAICFCFKISNT